MGGSLSLWVTRSIVQSLKFRVMGCNVHKGSFEAVNTAATLHQEHSRLFFEACHSFSSNEKRQY